jgi:hypothetical protein
MSQAFEQQVQGDRRLENPHEAMICGEMGVIAIEDNPSEAWSRGCWYNCWYVTITELRYLSKINGLG